MEQQGQPIGNTPTGTKVTSVPAPPVQEGPGAIAKDSLAAESSEFPDKYTSGVPGNKSTFNNTDTSGAMTLPPAGHASDRIPSEQNDGTKGSSGSKYPETVGKVEFNGTTSDEGYAGGPTSGRNVGSGVYQTGQGSNGGSSRSNADPASTYVQDVYLQDKSNGKPKGNNLKEGGFDDNAPNASFTTEIGTDQDPGRAGTAQFQYKSAGDAPDAGLPKTQKGLDTDHPYQSLNTEESA